MATSRQVPVSEFEAMSVTSAAGCVTSANWQGTLGEVSSPLERKYLQWGPHKAASFRLDAPGTQAKAYRVWYPEDMARNPGKKYPMDERVLIREILAEMQSEGDPA